MGRGKHLAKLDMYRKVPGDIVEGTKQGSFISWVAILVIFWLFYKETAVFFTTTLSSELSLDHKRSQDNQIKVSFNITMMDLKCDFVEVDVVSVLGNNQNATKFVKKVPLDANGVLKTMVRMLDSSRRIEKQNTFSLRKKCYLLVDVVNPLTYCFSSIES